MATESDSPRSPPDGQSDANGARVVPVSDPKGKGKAKIPPASASASTSDPMDISPSDDAPVENGHVDSGQNGPSNSSPEASGSNAMGALGPSAGSASQPKIVQTAFIHKLYNMLEDTSIKHLISWSASAESFVMSPTADFSKVLSQYFKHTNISSFVRQLNMYGFHKERDVFHTGNPDSTLWEFKHGNGNFKRGDLAGLREIKRRASKHTPIHKEPNYAKASSSQPGTPAEPTPMPMEGTEARINALEHTIFDISARLHRSEENAHYVHVKNQAIMEQLNRLMHLNQELSRSLLSIVPTDSPTHRDVIALQHELQRQSEIVRSLDDAHEPPMAGPSRPYLSNVDNAPVSPRQLPQDDARRAAPIPQIRGATPYRPHVSSNLSAGSRRPYGSISGTSPNQSSPLRNAAPAPPPPTQHLLPTPPDFPANMARRHTSADIREHGWQPQPQPSAQPGASPYSGSNPPSAQWPSSPNRNGHEDQQRLRESLSSYSLQGATRLHPQSRPTTPPPPPLANGNGNGNGDSFGNWTWNSASSRDGRGLGIGDSSAPPTRRGSMAHILNPSNGAGSEGEEDPRGDDDRKRKRMQ